MRGNERILWHKYSLYYKMIFEFVGLNCLVIFSKKWK